MDDKETALAKVDSGQAWTEFCQLLEKAGEVILRPDLARSTFDRAEGLRYLNRLLRAGSQTFAEQTGPKYPAFRAMPELVKMGLDNPDNYYLGASIRGDLDYRISGKRGSIHYMSFAAQNQNFAASDRITGGAGHLNDSDLVLEDDGSFEIIVSAREQPGNWLQMNEDTSQVLLRQTFLDRSRETPVEVAIECLQADGPAPPLDPARVPGQLAGTAMYALGCAGWFADWVTGMREKAEVNNFHLPDAEHHRLVGGDPNVRIWLGLWELGDDEALVIDLEPPACRYWNFQLANIWAESLDYATRRVHINNGSAVAEADGSVRLVVAHRDPGHANWIDTAGHEHGSMCVRWVLAREHPQPVTSVVPLSELA
ncbi:MAG: DUF1214 domain-containing protein [Proteobacteria bacterium]|nr:DUF1214 domain-containing protein [Pseudomonadota bacterium]